jgi:hypothetical protein
MSHGLDRRGECGRIGFGDADIGLRLALLQACFVPDAKA